MNRRLAHLKLLRPWQWIKNLFCLAGVIFAGKARDPEALWAAVLTMLAFCAVSSCIYALNDVLDREADARHPRKRNRPIPSGAVTPREGLLLALAMVTVGMIAAHWLPRAVGGLLGFYVVLDLAYSAKLKHVAVIDVMVIAIGFILRIVAGTAAINVPTSAWILLCTFFLAMFLGFAKRRAEIEGGGTGATTRAVLNDYTPAMLDRFCLIFATLTLAAYAVFTTSLGRDHTLVVTCPPVVFGILRYLYLVDRAQGDEQIEVLLWRDRPLQAAIAVWIALHAAILYFGFRLNIQ